MPDDLCAKHVLGGHGEMWGETVDASDLAQTVWPRLAAISERLWSPKGTTDAKAALPRIEAFRCLLNRRGISAAPPKKDCSRKIKETSNQSKQTNPKCFKRDANMIAQMTPDSLTCRVFKS